MKIQFKNIGSIKETELDLRSFTVIIGPNNSNKTFLSYTTYGIWKQLRGDLIPKPKDLKPKLEGKYVSFNIDSATISSFADMFRAIVNEFAKNLDGFFQDSSERIFSKTTLNLTITNSEIEAALKHLLEQKQLPSFGSGYLPVSRDGNTVRIEVTDEFKRQLGLPSQDLDFPMIFFCMGLQQNLFSNPFLLPAERNAFIITYKLLANRRYKFLKDYQRASFEKNVGQKRKLELLREQGDIRYPAPIEDFLDFLSDIEMQTLTKKEPKTLNPFHILADNIEHFIQNDNKTDFSKTRFGGKEIKIRVKEGLSIDLYNASSSIKQLSALLLYLRHRAQVNDLLIIDEPEMNLHPESQGKLLESLAILVNLGVRVLITTHSPYIMSHLNNLVGVDQIKRDDLRTNLFLQDERAFLSPKDVSAYEMRDYKLHSLMDDDFGIRWDTLSDVSSKIQHKYFEIHSPT